ncbi:hypothetical protein [Celeribacter sp.]|uniref:hypothetical protein n=1 Tax=Celeribacter sp. TaxID=1890673 RepID=UPI003A8FB782
MVIPKKIVFVIGQESSGSRLVAKACAASLGIVGFDDWNAIGWTHGADASVCHRSLPFGTPPRFPDIGRWLSKYGDGNELFFVITTRDVTLSDLSKVETFGKSADQVAAEREKVRATIGEVMASGHPYRFVSYETLMLLGEAYWSELYDALGIPPAARVFPELKDANRKRIHEMIGDITAPPRPAMRAKRHIRGTARRALDWIKGEAD